MNKAVEVEKYNQRLIQDFINCEGRFAEDALPDRSKEVKKLRYYLGAAKEFTEKAKRETDLEEKIRLMELADSHQKKVKEILNDMDIKEGREKSFSLEDEINDEAGAKDMRRLSGDKD